MYVKLKTLSNTSYDKLDIFMHFPLIYLLLMGPFASSSASKISRVYVCVCLEKGG